MPYVYEKTFDELYSTCEAAGKQFREYEQHYRGQSDRKADEAKEFAERCEAACKAWDDEE